MSFNSNGFSRCPSCKNVGTLRKSRPRNFSERIIKLFPFSDIFKCKKCGWRGSKTNIVLNAKEIKKLIVYIILAVVSAFIVFNILKLVI